MSLKPSDHLELFELHFNKLSYKWMDEIPDSQSLKYLKTRVGFQLGVWVTIMRPKIFDLLIHFTRW